MEVIGCLGDSSVAVSFAGGESVGLIPSVTEVG